MFSTPAASPKVAQSSGVAAGASTRTQSSRQRATRTLPLAFSNVPILLCALCFACGVLLSHWTWQPLAIAFAAVLLNFLLTLAALRLSSLRIVLVPLAALWLCLGLLCSELEPAPPAQKQLLSYADGLNRKLTGSVVSSSLLPSQPAAGGASQSGEAITSVDLDTETVEDIQPDVARMVPVQGGVRLTLYTPANVPAPALYCGELVQLAVQLRAPERFYDPGAWDYAAYLLEHGIGAQASAPSARLTVLDSPARPSLSCRLHAAQSWAGGRLAAYSSSRANRLLPRPLQLGAQDTGMLNAMLFGDRTQLDRGLRLGFERTGSFHLFVVSGLHLAVLAGLIFVLARRLRLPELPATLLTLALATGYAALTGFGLPVQRALWMTTVFLLVRLLSRDRNPLNALGIAALSLLAAHPHDLFEASFQMTALAIVAIAGIAVPLSERTFMPYARATHLLPESALDASLEPRLAQFRLTLRLVGEHLSPLLGRAGLSLPALLARWTLWFCELLLITCIAELFMTLPMAVYFHRVTALAIPANLLSIPFIGIMMPLVLLTFACSLIHPWVALVPGACTAALLHAITWTVTTISHFHTADVRIPAPALPVAALILLCWAFAVWAIRKRRWIASAGLAALLFATVLVLWPEAAVRHRGVLEVTALDVGQGDALLVVSPEGRTLLVDAGGPIGGPFAHNTTFDIGEEVVSPYLWSRRIRRLDAIALTHAHSDHMGGMPAILRNFRPRELWIGSNPDAPEYVALLAEARALGITVRRFHAGDSFVFGGTRVQVLAPQADYLPGNAPANNDSLVLDLHYGLSSALLEGDAEAASEQAMLRSGLILPATLLKAGHHGSRTSTTPSFLAAASPRAAVISVGRRNPFGHPRSEVILEFANARTLLYRTDLMGASSFFLNQNGALTARTFEDH